MMGFVLRVVISAIGLWVASALVPRVHYDSAGTRLLAGLLLGS